MKTLVDQSQKRIRYWDIVKGIAILLCVIGHQPGINSIVRRAIFTFHMPVFFIANAFFIRDYNLKKHIKRSARSLLVPYAVVCTISAVICVNLNNQPETNYQVFRDRMLDMLAGISNTSTMFTRFQSVWLVWFVICLFITRVIYIALMKILKKYPWWISLLTMICLSCLGIYIGKRIAFLPWSLDVALVSLIFMWAGNYLRISGFADKYSPMLYGIICLILWTILLIPGFQIELATRMYPGGMACVAEAVLGSMIILAFSKILDDIDVKNVSKPSGRKLFGQLPEFLAWCGTNSMIILGLHCLEMRFLNWSGVLLLGRESSQIHWTVLGVVKLFYILMATLLITKLKRGIAYLNEQ